MRNTRIIIHTDRLRANIRKTREAGGNKPLCMAIKANAYGHGAIACARIAREEGVYALGVSCAAEALELRNAGIDMPVILYAPPFPEETEELVRQSVEFFCPGRDGLVHALKAARKAGKQALVHIKVDTGMGRLGCTPEEAPELARFVCNESVDLRFRGLCTHLPLSDADRDGYTERQLKSFMDIAAGIKAAGLEPELVHASNSGGILNFDCSGFDMLRPGIMLYGYPGPEHELTPDTWQQVMEVRSRISFVKEVAAGTGISYGLRWQAPGPRWIGTVAMGYADGLPRSASSKICFASPAGTQSWPQVGTICMDQCMIDLGPSRDSDGKPLPCPARPLEEVVLFGSARGSAMSARDLAEKADTIPYEICCGMNARILREYLD